MIERLTLLAAAFLVVASCVVAQTTLPLRPAIVTLQQAEDLAVADFNLDGLPDLLVGSLGNHAAVHVNTRGAPAGFWSSPVALVPAGTGSAETYRIAAGDLDFDGDPDVVVGTTGTSTPSLSVFQNTSTGSGMPVLTEVARASAPVSASSVAILDFLPRPGREIAVGDDGQSGGTPALRIFGLDTSSTGSLELRLLASIPTGGPIAQLAHADLDQDGFEDVLAGDANGLTVVFGGTTSSPRTLRLAMPADRRIEVGDVDGDGRLDLMALGGSARLVTLATQSAPGTFSTFDMTAFVGNPDDFVLGNLNGDEFADIALAMPMSQGEVSVLGALGTGNTATWFETPVTLASQAPSATRALVLSEVNGFPGDDLIRLEPDAATGNLVRRIETWANIAPQLDAPYPGSRGDFVLETAVAGATRTNIAFGEPIKRAGRGDFMALSVRSPLGSANGGPFVIVGQFFATGSPIEQPLASFGVRINTGLPYRFLADGVSIGSIPGFSTGGLPLTGHNLILRVSTDPTLAPLPGTSFLVQGAVIDQQGNFQITDGHEFRF